MNANATWFILDPQPANSNRFAHFSTAAVEEFSP
jgi:hypothetical protein